ncbi:hypothetical protein DDZ13_10230 [Coraliomargarita sinensis]|uniref:Uncharacterized protein n=1 Tax=Coraliomargarita sinensis TaxID=2174842 RepID=A0A317ZE55_9BACT|nr:hypothetical protein DDZ13_10230 [Coraliomargarita sinensis]
MPLEDGPLFSNRDAQANRRSLQVRQVNQLPRAADPTRQRRPKSLQPRQTLQTRRHLRAEKERQVPVTRISRTPGAAPKEEGNRHIILLLKKINQLLHRWIVLPFFGVDSRQKQKPEGFISVLSVKF